MRIPMSTKIGPEFQRFQWKDNIRIPVFIKLEAEVQCFKRRCQNPVCIKIGPEF